MGYKKKSKKKKNTFKNDIQAHASTLKEKIYFIGNVVRIIDAIKWLITMINEFFNF